MATVDGVPSCPQCGSARIWQTVGSLTYVTCPVCRIAVESSLISHVSPEPTDALRVAAMATIRAIHRYVSGDRPRNRPHAYPCGCNQCELWQAETALRAAVELAPAPPVVLTDAGLMDLVKAAHTIPYGVWMDKDYDLWAFRAESLRVKLADLGITLTREARP